MRIVGYGISPLLSSRLRSLFGSSFHVRDALLAPEDADPETSIAVIFLNSRITPDIIDVMPSLGHIICASGGSDHIDSEYCRKKGIPVLSCNSYSAVSVAELSICLALSGLRRLDRILPVASLPDCPPGLLCGSTLCGKKAAVLGTGNIGSCICDLLSAFGCQVSAYSRSAKKSLAERGVGYLPIDDVLSQADLVFISLPLTEETRGMLNDRRLSLIRDGAGIINVSRAEVIDAKALLVHLPRYSFYATDVLHSQAEFWQGASLPDESRLLLQKDNVIRTPHIGACTAEASSQLNAEIISLIYAAVKEATARSA